MAGRNKSRGHVRFHTGQWYAVMPTVHAEDGGTSRPWYKADPNTECEANELLARKLVEYDQQRLPMPTPETVGSWVAEFLDRHDVEPSTLSGYRQALNNRVNHPDVGIGRVKLQHLTASRLDAFYLDLQRLGYAKSTIAQTHRVLSVALKEAVRKRKLSHSPVQDATLPKFERRTRKALLIDRKKLWTAQELRAFLEHTRPDRWYPLWHLLATTGLRRSELCGLRWESLDLANAVLIVDWKVVAVHHQLHEGDPKSESSIREVTLDDATVRTLREWRKRVAEERLAAGIACQDSAFVFTDELGLGLHPNRLNYRFTKAVRTSGLRHTTPHGLRHLHATLLLDAGVPVKEVSARLGHSSTTFTQDRYIKVTEAMDRGAATTMAKILQAS